MEITLEGVRSIVESDAGFHATLKMQFVAGCAEVGSLTLRLPYRDIYARIPHVGDYHGGIIASVLDVAGTFACMLKCRTVTPTNNIRIDYLKAPVKCDLIVIAQVLRAGRSTAVADVRAAGEDGTVFAVARGTWAVMPTQ